MLEKKLAQSAYANIDWQKQSSNRLVEGLDYCPSLSSPVASNPFIISFRSKVISRVKFTKQDPKNYIQIKGLNIMQSRLYNSWTESTSNNHKQKSNAASPPKIKPEKRRLIFWKQANFLQKSKTDFILVLDQFLQKLGISTYMRFSRVGYFQSSTIYRLLTKMFNSKDLIRHHSKILIQAAKLINERVIQMESLKWWDRIKIYRMSLIRYLGKRKIEILS